MLFTYYQHVPLPRPLGRTDEILPLLHRHLAAARRVRLHRRGDRRGGAVAVDQRDGGDDGQRLLSEVRAARRRRGDADARVAAGDDRLGHRADRASRSARSGCERSVLDAGLAVLSLTTGPVLGAFLVGVLTRHVGSRAMLGGMAAGAVVMARDLVDRRRRVDVVGAGRCRDHERGGPAARALPRIPNCAGRSGGGRVNNPDRARGGRWDAARSSVATRSARPVIQPCVPRDRSAVMSTTAASRAAVASEVGRARSAALQRLDQAADVEAVARGDLDRLPVRELRHHRGARQNPEIRA